VPRKTDLTPRVVKGELAADANPGRASIDFPLGEAADAVAVNSLRSGRRDENHAVERVERSVWWMLDLRGLNHCSLNPHPNVSQTLGFARNAVESEIGRIDVLIGLRSRYMEAGCACSLLA